MKQHDQRTKRRPLTLVALQNKLAKEKDDGGLIYIKNVDSDGNPLNFSVDGATAVSGKWKNGLTGRPISWVLVFQRTDRNQGRVWVGDYAEAHEYKKSQKFDIHLSNLVGPLEVEMSFKNLTGKAAPLNPIYLVSGKEISLKAPHHTASSDAHLESDLENIFLSVKTANTTIPQQILARLGQGKFREDVLELWGNACAVTGSKTIEVLRASHIRPWCDSDDKDRLNPMNGLPLVATLDALFDRGLITFEDNGRMLVSEKLSAKECKLFRLNSTSRLIKMLDDPEHKKFLKYHRTEFQKNHNAKVFET